MDDMNMNNEPPVYDSGDMKPTDPFPTEGENDAGFTEELPMYEDTSTGDRGGRMLLTMLMRPNIVGKY